MTAVFHDTYEAFKMVVDCFQAGAVGCACTAALLLQPEWTKPTDTRYTDTQKCYPPADAWANIEVRILETVEGALGGVLSDVGDFFSSTFSGGNGMSASLIYNAVDAEVVEKCRLQNLNGQGPAGQCFFDRIREICHNNELYLDFVAAHGVTEEEFGRMHVDDLQLLSGVLADLDLYTQPLALCRQADQLSLDMVRSACFSWSCALLPPGGLLTCCICYAGHRSLCDRDDCGQSAHR